MSAYALETTIAATKYNLDPRVVQALIQVESDGDPWAWNPEPKYRYLWDLRHHKPFRVVDPSELASKVPPGDFYCIAGDPDQEWWGQQASFGLMQLMGAVARELGYGGPYLTRLCDPELNLEFGCRKLAADLQWAHGDTRSMLASWNGGRSGNAPGSPLRNAAYADKVAAQLQVRA